MGEKNYACGQLSVFAYVGMCMWGWLCIIVHVCVCVCACVCDSERDFNVTELEGGNLVTLGWQKKLWNLPISTLSRMKPQNFFPFLKCRHFFKRPRSNFPRFFIQAKISSDSSFFRWLCSKHNSCLKMIVVLAQWFWMCWDHSVRGSSPGSEWPGNFSGQTQCLMRLS